MFGSGNGNGNDDLSLDIDGNGEIEAFTDGILAVRFLFGLTGDALIRDAVGAGASRSSADAITNYLEQARDTMLDVDDNGGADALTDGIVIVRYMFGLGGDPLIGGAIASNANRTESADIEAFLQGFDLPAAGLEASLQLNSSFPDVSTNSFAIV